VHVVEVGPSKAQYFHTWDVKTETIRPIKADKVGTMTYQISPIASHNGHDLYNGAVIGDMPSLEGFLIVHVVNISRQYCEYNTYNVTAV